VEPNNVYVIPSNRNLSIANDVLRLSKREDTFEKHGPVDCFMRSLAEDKHNRAIGVILSGLASDGTLGLGAIKAKGGITFGQDEKSARYYAMPLNAITAGCVDFELPPDQIAEELARLARHPDADTVEEARRKESLPPLEGQISSADTFHQILHLLRKSSAA